jgi:hypothetical protein
MGFEIYFSQKLSFRYHILESQNTDSFSLIQMVFGINVPEISMQNQLQEKLVYFASFHKHIPIIK